MLCLYYLFSLYRLHQGHLATAWDLFVLCYLQQHTAVGTTQYNACSSIILVDKDCCLATTQTILLAVMGCVLIKDGFWKIRSSSEKVYIVASKYSMRLAWLQSLVQ